MISREFRKPWLVAQMFLAVFRKPVTKTDLIALPLANAYVPKTRNQNVGPGDNSDRACTTIQLSAK